MIEPLKMRISNLLLLTVLTVFTASVPTHAFTKLYVGEFEGRLGAGIEAELEIGEIGFIGYEIRSLGLDKDNRSVGFSPEKVLYIFKAGNDSLEYEHRCLHLLDNRDETQNYITDQIKWKVRL